MGAPRYSHSRFSSWHARQDPGATGWSQLVGVTGLVPRLEVCVIAAERSLVGASLGIGRRRGLLMARRESCRVLSNAPSLLRFRPASSRRGPASEDPRRQKKMLTSCYVRFRAFGRYQFRQTLGVMTGFGTLAFFAEGTLCRMQAGGDPPQGPSFSLYHSPAGVTVMVLPCLSRYEVAWFVAYISRHRIPVWRGSLDSAEMGLKLSWPGETTEPSMIVSIGCGCRTMAYHCHESEC